MMGETIVGIALLDGGISSTANGDMVSLQMVLFNYFKMDDEFAVFAELHQTKELRPVFAIIPTCNEIEPLVQMINKVPAFLYYFLKDVGLSKKFLRELLCETCNATLVAKIQDYDWVLNTKTITNLHKKK